MVPIRMAVPRSHWLLLEPKLFQSEVLVRSLVIGWEHRVKSISWNNNAGICFQISSPLATPSSAFTAGR